MMEATLDESLVRAVRSWARQAAPGLLADVLEGARAEAASILRRQLVDALLQEAGRLGEPTVATDVRSKPSRRHDGQIRSAPDGVYVYGFTLVGTGCSERWRGVDGSLTSAIVEGDLVAIVSDVSGACHAWSSGPDGEPDLSALATRAQQHEQVLEKALEQGPVVPMRFGTMYPSHEAVRQVLRAHHPAIRAAITDLDGKAEWGLTVTWDGRQTASPGGQLASANAMPATGRGYLARREAEKAAAEQLAEQRREVASGLHRAIQGVAQAGVIHPTRRAGSPDEKHVLLRASYLVDTTDRDDFEKVIVEGLKSRTDLGLGGELTGPWPPYNFSRLELQGALA